MLEAPRVTEQILPPCWLLEAPGFSVAQGKARTRMLRREFREQVRSTRPLQSALCDVVNDIPGLEPVGGSL